MQIVAPIGAELSSTMGPQVPFDPAISFAFQPIVDTVARRTVSYEALVRGTANQSAASIFDQVSHGNLHRFDGKCRDGAIALASRLGLTCDLNLNFLPQTFYSAQRAIHDTIQTAERHNLPSNRIVLEITEGGIVEDPANFARFLNQYRALGIKLAIDDFGSGYSGLNLLADFQPEQIKLDRKLVHGIQTSGPRQAIVRAIVQVCQDLGIDLVVEGIETAEEYLWFSSAGVSLFQGYFFARPGFQCLPTPEFPS
jgi:EAL domain-containing protein (putative c-di-GMP-specific phosphodiesterase class I)